MRITLSSRGDYAVRAVMYLASHPGLQRGPVISDVMHIPDRYLPQIMGSLVRAGIVRSSLGRHGGYVLVRHPGSLSMREVLEVVEGPLDTGPAVCPGGICDWDGEAAVHAVWNGAWAAMIDRLDRTTFDQLVAGGGGPASLGVNRGPEPAARALAK